MMYPGGLGRDIRLVATEDPNNLVKLFQVIDVAPHGHQAATDDRLYRAFSLERSPILLAPL